jgi:protocatechuate 3,4-dioxygenase beta subunit
MRGDFMKTAMDRREVLRMLGAAIACTPLVPLIGCGAGNVTGGETGGGTPEGGLDAGSSEGASAADAGGWATGGTASMTGKASYPDPFAGGSTSGCVATGALTEGPCYDSASEVIQDISYGQNGLPMRMVLQVLDASCNPIAGAVVDVWHVAPTGKYSGDDATNENVAFCTGNDSDYTSHLYFRGKQTTDPNGVVTFDSCFPGWYSGRTIHVHFTITAGSKTFTSQYVFDDTLDDEIVGTQPVYSARGARDTTNQTDTVVSASTAQQFTFQTQKMADGALLAWKAIVVSA